MKLLFGCDPELFILNDKRELVSGYGLIPGTKKNPHRVVMGAVQLDGMAAEFNIDPTSSCSSFYANVDTVYHQLLEMLPKGYRLSKESSVTFPQHVIDAQPASCLELGCEADYNAYTGDVNPSPDATKNFRTASGHIHIGWLEEPVNDPFEHNHFNMCMEIVKELDWALGLYSILHDHKGHARRQLYGKAGCFRPKKYGVEYRTLSNFWVQDYVHTMNLLRNVVSAVDALRSGNFLHQCNQDVARHIIDNNDEMEAEYRLNMQSLYIK